MKVYYQHLHPLNEKVCLFAFSSFPVNIYFFFSAPSPAISNRDDEEDEPSGNQSVPPPPPKPDHRDDASIIDDEEINYDDDQPSVQNPDKHDTAPSPTPRARDLSPEPSIPPATTTAADDIDNFFD